MLRAAAVVGNAGVADFERGSRETLDGRTRSLGGARHCTGGAREPRAARRQRRQGARALCRGRVEHSRLLCNEGECDASAVIAVGAFALPRRALAHPSCRKRRLPRAKVSTDHQRQHIRDARPKRRERCDRLGLERRLAARQLRPGPQACAPHRAAAPTCPRRSSPTSRWRTKRSRSLIGSKSKPPRLPQRCWPLMR
jgi:hypothetical protein